MTYPPQQPEPDQQPGQPTTRQMPPSYPQQPFSSPEPSESSAPYPSPAGPAPQRPKRSRAELVLAGTVGLILGIAIGGGAVAFMLRPNPPASNPAANSDRQQVLTACHEAVKDRLKSPATAQFSREEVGGYNAWVRGKVDSQNGFGALVRSSFECYLTNNDGPWHVTSVDVTQD